VQERERVVGHRVALRQDGGGPRVGPAGVCLLVVGHGHHPQGEDLVDLGGVEQVAGALRRNSGVVAEHDRRHEDGVRPVVVGDHDRPAPVLRAGRGVGGCPVGPVQQRDEAGATRGQQQVGAHQ
jgi:hypothetical protein